MNLKELEKQRREKKSRKPKPRSLEHVVNDHHALAVKQKLHTVRFDETIRQRIYDELTDDAIRSLGIAIRGDTPFKEPQGWAIRNYLEATKTVGAQFDVAALLLKEVGSDAQTAREGVALLESVESMDEDAVAAETEQWLKTYYQRKGKMLVIIDARKKIEAV